MDAIQEIKVWTEGETVVIETSVDNRPKFGRDILNPGLGEIDIKHQGETVYIKGEKGNAILLECNSSERMRLVTPYSHLIPTWMKEDFNKFLEE